MAQTIKNLPTKQETQEMWVQSPFGGDSPGVGNGSLLQNSCLENSVGRGAWRATGHMVAKSWTRLKRLSMARHRTL